jgi:hypothetical protein
LRTIAGTFAVSRIPDLPRSLGCDNPDADPGRRIAFQGAVHVTSDYAAIVIGSGSGGLPAALALARAGQRVVVYARAAA